MSNTNDQEHLLETEFAAFLFYTACKIYERDKDAKPMTLMLDSSCENWRKATETDREKARALARTIMHTANTLVPGYGKAAPKKLAQALRTIITIPAAPAYKFEFGDDA
jgi:uncharacterized protein YaaN involved in tellurite resistance